LRQTLLECYEAGVIEIHAEPPNFVTHGGPQPKATEWARWQAAHGEVVANCRLMAVPLEPFDAQVLELLDGRRDFESLVELLVASAQQGRLGVVEQARQIENPTRLREVLRLALRQSLARLAQNALLIA
jgi:methyltransferase-like protein